MIKTRSIASLAAVGLIGLAGVACSEVEEAPEVTTSTIHRTITRTPSAPATQAVQSQAPTWTSEKDATASRPSRADRDIPAAVIGDRAANFVLGPSEPGQGSAKNVSIPATSSMKANGGFRMAKVTVTDENSNALLQYPLLGNAAVIDLNMVFRPDGGQSQEFCQADMEVYDEKGNPVPESVADVSLKFTRGNCIVAAGSDSFGIAEVQIFEPGDYYVVVAAWQPDFEEIRIASKVRVTEGN
ncbi:hypothetical protein [Corynebacterium pelargi]|uniref:Uncharacterized protein n=1 Tax=Corynebacterium pelargi TaxID=1471400 RepID=A0A410W6P4_9CORY|nr:hypothetical protein [Corynebacterium pelargi]QAU51633.1 hypothetical protein CPELA_01670 [Corynebacterium pelargi]GGG80175.1 hypothetical protein GCM10007338_18250 [Corynebacterium pelargi]